MDLVYNKAVIVQYFVVCCGFHACRTMRKHQDGTVARAGICRYNLSRVAVPGRVETGFPPRLRNNVKIAC